jgi:hypothetical protein
VTDEHPRTLCWPGCCQPPRRPGSSTERWRWTPRSPGLISTPRTSPATQGAGSNYNYPRAEPPDHGTAVATRRISDGDLLRRCRGLLIRGDRRHHGHTDRHRDVPAVPRTHTTSSIAFHTCDRTPSSSPNTSMCRRSKARASRPGTRKIPLNRGHVEQNVDNKDGTAGHRSSR